MSEKTPAPDLKPSANFKIIPVIPLSSPESSTFHRPATKTEAKPSGEKQVETPIVDAGNVAGFFRRFKKGEDKIGIINELRKHKILAYLVEEGTMIGGYVSRDGLGFLTDLGGVTLSAAEEGRPALFKLGDKPGERQGQRTLIGSIPTAAAARARSVNKQIAVRIADRPHANSFRVKHTELEEVPIRDLKLGDYSDQIPTDAFGRIEASQVSRIHLDKVYILKIDGNSFVDRIRKAQGKEGQAGLIRRYDKFFNEITRRIKEEIAEGSVLFGDAQTDSELIYLPNIFTVRKIQEILAGVMGSQNISAKVSGTSKRDVDLTLVDGRVAISSKPVDEIDWATNEDVIKQELKRYSTEANRHFIQSQVRFGRDSYRRKKLLRGEF